MSTTSESHPVVNGLITQVPDNDPAETAEWIESLSGLIDEKGGPRARYILLHMLDRARRAGVQLPMEYTTPYVNTIPVEDEPFFPGDEAIERQYRRWIRWNAAVQVTRAQRPGVKVGGHISSYASVATLYEVGLNHFFRGKDHPGGGDHVFFQGHASPGPYARAFLEGRLSEEEMDGFRQQVSTAAGLPSYPHPRQLPEFWEFPTVSLGLGPAAAIYQAWFDRYLHMRGLKDTSQQHTWAFIGDGEMDEPESRGMLQLAAQQGLDNLTFVINCNLQRLDGPVRGNGKIIQELEAFFKGAGWNVIKVIWGRGWDQLLAADKDSALVNVMNETLDGDYQTFKANDGGYVREQFFGRDPRTKALVENWSDEQIWALGRGGHDYRKVYAAYKAAMDHTGQPTVILAHTIKGYILGSNFAGRNSTHQMKKLTLDDAKALRDRLEIPITDEQLEADPYKPPYYMPPADHPALIYMKERREKLGGWVPERRDSADPKLPELPARPFEALSKGSGQLEVATTMALVRLMKDLLKDKNVGPYIVPIIPDEARTFGLDAIFPTAKIFNTHGQNYTAVDADLMLSYKESQQGQVLHTGITEAGSAAALQAAGTAYTTHNLPMVPFYIFYSMFGFQRTGDSFWAAADQLARGFVIGATAGRTTLTGEGLQHLDGHSPIMAATNHGFVAYDPAYAYEIRHIVYDGLQRMYGPEDGRDPNVMYYLTVYNEPVSQPAEPANLDREGLLRGIYKVADHSGSGHKVQILASGVGVPWAIRAKEMLAADWGIDAAVWSVTSWTELRRDAVEVEEHNFLHPNEEQRVPFVTQRLSGAEGPFIASSDYDKMVPDLIRKWVPGKYHVLGADGFGVSDTRRAARRYFHVDPESIVTRTLAALAEDGVVDRSVIQQAIDRYDLFNCAIPAEGEVED
ncbi:MAG: pyruvate dehydrogenase (acetyl-transferring), homodimeric type [Actinomycetaceae bacterium]|nr:pyruvate dehydrogenase (acetyl-transferring), homodimeric type [Actinomycetaceae bacterium]